MKNTNTFPHNHSYEDKLSILTEWKLEVFLIAGCSSSTCTTIVGLYPPKYVFTKGSTPRITKTSTACISGKEDLGCATHKRCINPSAQEYLCPYLVLKDNSEYNLSIQTFHKQLSDPHCIADSSLECLDSNSHNITSF